MSYKRIYKGGRKPKPISKQVFYTPLFESEEEMLAKIEQEEDSKTFNICGTSLFSRIVFSTVLAVVCMGLFYLVLGMLCGFEYANSVPSKFALGYGAAWLFLGTVRE